ncbi:hypothetical protein TNCV_1977741 [Trichonephila clavipes]|nr:hypothetical protein TNCV_1977741 [Trichonephila clavipes]
MNSARYNEALSRFMKRLLRSTTPVCTRFGEQIEHPPYSPDFNSSSDFFLFPRPKLALKGKRFGNIPETQ